MCSYSMVHDFARDFIPRDAWTLPMVSEYQEIIRRLKEIDDKLNLPNCNENKGEFLDEIRKRLEAVEKKVGL